MKRIKGYNNLIRDNNDVVHNIDKKALKAAKARKKEELRQENRLLSLENEIDYLKKKIETLEIEIKNGNT